MKHTDRMGRAYSQSEPGAMLRKGKNGPNLLKVGVGVNHQNAARKHLILQACPKWASREGLWRDALPLIRPRHKPFPGICTSSPCATPKPIPCNPPFTATLPLL